MRIDIFRRARPSGSRLEATRSQDRRRTLKIHYLIWRDQISFLVRLRIFMRVGIFSGYIDPLTPLYDVVNPLLSLHDPSGNDISRPRLLDTFSIITISTLLHTSLKPIIDQDAYLFISIYCHRHIWLLLCSSSPSRCTSKQYNHGSRRRRLHSRANSRRLQSH
jgi:hypothetical protein